MPVDGLGHRAGLRVAGWDVVLRDVTDEASKGVAAIRASYGKLAEKGTLEPAADESALARIAATTDLAAVADADIVVEAVFEKVDVKRELFRTLDGWWGRTPCSRPTPPPSRSPRLRRPPRDRSGSSASTSSRRCR